LELAVRLPSDEPYAARVEKEQRSLPVLNRQQDRGGFALVAEGERFELSGDVTAVNGFRDRPEYVPARSQSGAKCPGNIRGNEI
jgi:hypothetical protein